MPGMTVRDVVVIALEAIPGSTDTNLIDMRNAVVRDHVVAFVKEFARNRGVIFVDKDIVDEINVYLAELKQIAITRAKTPR